VNENASADTSNEDGKKDVVEVERTKMQERNANAWKPKAK
jgi:hypothetical protein